MSVILVLSFLRGLKIGTRSIKPEVELLMFISCLIRKLSKLL